LTLAAVFLVAAIGLLYWNQSLRRQIEQFSQPRILEDVLGLVPAGTPYRTEAGQRVRASDSEPVVLMLTLADSTLYSSYRVDITDQKGVILWTHQANHRTSTGSLAVLLPRQSLPAGEFRVLLYGRKTDYELLETYEIEIVSP